MVRPMKGSGGVVRCVENGVVVASRVVRATRFLERLRGLLGRASLAADEGLWLEPCDGVHTWFMRFPIDVAVLDADGRVLRCLGNLPPWRVTRLHAGARVCLELSAGTLARTGLRVGDRLLFEGTS
jgi:uncharacterized membrane protein (UPF0127 family)